MRAEESTAVVDLAGVAELSDIITVSDTTLTLGARVSHRARTAVVARGDLGAR